MKLFIRLLRLKSITAVPSILSAFAASAWAQTPDKIPDEKPEKNQAERIYELTEFQVSTSRTELNLPMDAVSQSGSRLGLSAWELSGSVDVIDQQRMQERGDRNTTEAVTGAPGFSDSNSGGNLSGFSARGFRDVTVLYDGISLGKAGMTARPQGTWIFERVETISGPASILHGEGSIVGAVNFVPRRPNPNETETDLLMSIGSFGSTRVAVGHGGPTDVEGLSFRIDAERQISDGYTDNSELERDTVSASLRYDASDQLTFTANLVYLDDSLPPYFGVPVDAKGKPAGDNPRGNFNASDAIVEGEELRLTLDTEYRLSDTITLKNRTHANWAERAWSNVESSEIEASGDITQNFAFVPLTHDQFFFANRSEALIGHDLFGGQARSSLGLEFSWDDFASDRTRIGDVDIDVGDPNNPNVGTVSSILSATANPSSTTNPRNERTKLALFGENRLNLGGGFSLISGLRGELIRMDTKENISSGDVDIFVRDQKTFHAGDAKLGFVWAATEQFSLFGQATSGSKFSMSSSIPRIDQFDRDLERSLGFELGVRGRAMDGSWEWQIVAFDIEKRDRVVSDPDNPGETAQVGRQTSQGLEVSAYAEPFERLALEFNGSVLDAEFHDDARFGGNTPSNVPKHLFNFWATWTLTDKLLARAHVRHVGEAQSDNGNTLEVPSYTLLNLSSRYSLNENWDVTFRVRNVTDELYFTQGQFGPQFYVGDGRGFELELKASF